MKVKTEMNRGVWMARSVECLTLDFSSGHDLPVCEFKPCVRLCTDRVETAWDSLSFSLSLPLPCSLSKKKKTQKNKQTKKKQNQTNKKNNLKKALK